MAQIGMSFTVKASKKMLGAIHSMAVAIEDEGFYGAEFDYEEGGTSLEANVENLDLDGLLGWVAIFQAALKENGRNRFSFTLEGEIETVALVISMFSFPQKLSKVKRSPSPSNGTYIG